MNIKSYHISSPEQLNELGKFAKSDKLISLNRCTWNIERRKKNDTPWNYAFFAEFYSYGTARKAVIIRHARNGSVSQVAELKYNAALQWCKQNSRLKADMEREA